MKLHAVPDTPPRAVLYLRQSVYRDDSISIEMQESAGRDYCDRMGYDIVMIEADQGLSGRKWDNRPAVKRVIDMIEAAEADVVILWKWSRLSRSRRDWVLAADRVDVAGGRIESATEPIDTATASGRFARGVMTEYAAFQSEQIGEQWEEVRQRRLRLGLPTSGRLPWGWRRTDTGIEPNPEQAPLVVAMYRKYLAGNGSAAISRWMNAQAIPSPNGGTWNRVRPFTVMDSPIHAGKVPYRGEVYEGQHEGIIDQATWDRYQAMRKDRRGTGAKPRQSAYLLSGLVRCGCGLRMQGKGAVTGGIWYGGYICTSMDPEHGRNYVSAKKLEPLVQTWLESLAEELDAAVDLAPKVENESTLVRLLAEQNAQQRRIDKLTSLYIDDKVSDASYAAARSEVEARQTELREQISEVRTVLAGVPDVSRDLVRDMVRDWELFDVTGRQELIGTVLRRVGLNIDAQSASFDSLWGHSSLLHW
ncbi:recombinase family protein [Cryobacterium sp. TMT1-21]|uniref:recombinase family protein n=1 Tax=Cryobacterium sp. TMT1-21 TaxID=1259234 RepID=UPI00106C08AD|nr:recombinase family protein [Cryobacterium sp. TMT1-21]TFD16190.1 recombinase family protein [Cryobacterium sp. TMT1-21]